MMAVTPTEIGKYYKLELFTLKNQFLNTDRLTTPMGCSKILIKRAGLK